jgi:DNA-binding CsgD family transcriptional regulator
MAFALPTAEIQRIGPAVTARAEMQWLAGDVEAAQEELESTLTMAAPGSDRWTHGELALWLHRAGGVPTETDQLPLVYRLSLAGNWRGAADEWDRIGAPYERALALAADDDPESWRESIARLEALGAPAAVAAVRRDLHRRGARGIPRGPRPATRRNPAGLTTSQIRVLELLVRGLSNADIARELFLSPRTVDHHVSAILAKLEVTTRAAAIAAAHDRQVLRQS